jgi:hypothetical protein
MDAPLDDLYLEWLYEQVAVPTFHDRDLTYWKVLKVLYQKEFFWSVEKVPNDENRAHDGIALRSEFILQKQITDVDPDWLDMGCSILELMVALAKRLAFDAFSGEPYYWFWVLMDNIGLSGYSDDRRFTKRLLDRINSILDEVIERRYEPSGLGGFFPLQVTRYDQRERELWYQMSDFIVEKELAG